MKHILLTLLCLLFAMQQAKADWSLSNDGVLTITSDYSYSSSSSYGWYSKRSSIKSVVFTDAVTSIGKNAFYSCTGLTSVTIPNGLTSIGNYAFSGCTGLTSVTIPNSVTSIGYEAFRGCTSVKTLKFEDGETGLKLETQTFADCPLVEFYLGRNLSLSSSKDSPCYNKTSLTSVKIGDKVTRIGEYAFSGCTGLTSITIPNGVTSIGDYAFKGCISLKSLKFEDGETKLYLSDEIFTDCPLEEFYLGRNLSYSSDYHYYINSPCYCKNSLTSVTIGDKVTSIGDGAFSGCTGLTSVTISNSVENIGSSAFWGCTGLTSISIGNSVTSIGSEAFQGCTSLTSITIPNSVTSIGIGAFWGCTGLTSVTIGNSVTSIGEGAFQGCTSLTSITIPNSVTSIGEGAFQRCTGLTSVTIGNSVTSIGDGAFWWCTGLTSITIPNSVESIGDNAFYSCTGLTSVIIGNSVESIGENAFLNCTSLEEVKSEVVAPFNYSAFTNLTIYIPEGTKKAYIDNWGITNKYIEVPEADGGLVLDNVAPGTLAVRVVLAGYKLNEVSKLTISGSLNADDWAIVNNSMNSLWSLDLSGLKSEFQGNEQISEETCSRYYELVLPDGTEKINDSAFQGFVNLIYLTIPASLDSIGASAFSDCSSLRYLTTEDYPQSGDFVLGGNISYVGNYAFYGCKNLSEVTIGDRVKTIGEYAFKDCTSLTSVSIGRGLESIPSYAFCDCSNLQEVTIGKSVKEIAYDAFYGTKVITITCYANAAPSVAQSFSSISPSSCKLYVPKTGLLSYATHQVWSQFDYEGIDGLSDAIVLWVDKHGSVSVNSEEYYYGEHIIETTAGEGYTLSFKAEAGYALNSVNVDGEDITDKLVNNTYEYTAEASDLVLAATFIDAANRAKLSFDANCGSVEILSVSADTMRLAITPKNEHVLVGIFVDGEKIFDGNKLKSASVGAQMNEDGTITISGILETSTIEVRFSGATPVVNIKTDNKATIVGIYALSGQNLGTSTDNLPKGVYIVVYSNGTSQKTLVK